jgi:hypothetical protein
VTTRIAVLALGVALAACGGASAPSGAEAPSQAAPAAAPASPESVHAGAGTSDHVDVGPTAPVPRPQPGIAAARSDLDRAEREVAASRSDCATACRALSSMERAAEHLCALDAGTECSRARERVDAARERVRASCGGCGP